MTTHYFRPAHATNRSGGTPDGNVKPCCDKPEAEHPAFLDGTTVRIMLTRKVRSFNGTVRPQGSIVIATRESIDYMAYVSQSKWGTNELGQFAELVKAVTKMVKVPGYLIMMGDMRTAIPATFGKEVV